jgi:hypothetical protein
MSRCTCALLAALLFFAARPSIADQLTVAPTAIPPVTPSAAPTVAPTTTPTDAPTAAVPAGAPPNVMIPDSRLRGLAVIERRLLRDALSESATVRELTGRVERSDLIVFVHIGMLETGLTGTTQLVSCAGGVRYILVTLDPRATPTERVANLGHELRHVVEIADAPDVKTAEQMKRLFQHIGWRSGRDNRWETSNAIEAGRQVLREVSEHGSQIGGDDSPVGRDDSVA